MKQTSVISRIFVILWLAILFSGIAFKISVKLTGWPDFTTLKLNENRELEAAPDLRRMPLAQWPAAIEKWYNDNFAMRPQLITANNWIHRRLLKAPYGNRVPGRGDWVYMRGGNWRELDDFLGCYELSDAELDEWLTLLEGRVEWARLHGARYLTLIAPSKAFVHPEHLRLSIAIHRGVTPCDQLRAALAERSINENVIFPHDEMRAVAKTEDVFFHEDHHPTPKGIWLLYKSLDDRLAKWYPQARPMPFFDRPSTNAPCCYPTEYERLEVLNPAGSSSDPIIPGGGGVRGTMRSLTYNSGGTNGLWMVIAHDSYMRYSLTTWHPRGGLDDVKLPTGAHIRRVSLMMFHRYTTESLEGIVKKEVPDVIVEQFNQVRLSLGVIGFDEVMLRAAQHARGEPIPAAILDNVARDGEVALLSGDAEIAKLPVKSGVRRVLFFPSTTAENLRLELRGTSASRVELQ